MKKTTLVMAICLLVGIMLSGCNYVGVTGGHGGNFDATNFTIEYGSPLPEVFKSEYGERDWMLTGGMLIIDNAIESPFIKSSPEMGSFIKLGIEVAPDTGLFANVLGGVTFIHWTSRWDKDVEMFGLFGGGVTYFIADEGTCIIAGYDNRRGITAGVGWRF